MAFEFAITAIHVLAASKVSGYCLVEGLADFTRLQIINGPVASA
jgi:hypothetical protein